MAIQFTTASSILEKRAKQNYEKEVAYKYNGEMKYVKKKVKDGMVNKLELTKPIGEMITKSQSSEELIRKVVLDVDLSQDRTALLYKSLYQTIVDRDFSEYIDANFASFGKVYFFDHLEGEEIKFGSLDSAEGVPARLKTVAAAFQYTEDMVEYNQQFKVQLMIDALGEAYNAKLNDLHLNPIITHKYTGNQVTPPHEGYAEDFALRLNTMQTLRNGIQTSRQYKRNGTILLANTADEFQIRDAFENLTVGATPFSAVSGIEEVILYDGYETTVGRKTYNYPGVEPGKVFLVRPKRGFVEFIKHDLLIDIESADLTRLVKENIVARARRGTFAAVEDNVQEIRLPQLQAIAKAKK